MTYEEDFPEYLYPYCQSCRRFLVVGALFENLYRDTETMCHSCLQARNHEAEIELQMNPSEEE